MQRARWKVATAVAGVVLLSSTAAYATHVFVDVDDSRFYADATEWALDNGITTGCGDGTTFCPDDPVTRGENITFAKRYDDNIVQPALAEIGTRLDDLEAGVADNTSAIGENDTAIADVAADLSQATRVHFARVADDGTVQQSSTPAIAVSRSGTGLYTATLPEPAANCTIATSLYASVADSAADAVQASEYADEAFIFTIHNEDGATDAVSIRTYTQDGTEFDVLGTATDLPFSITAYCSGSS